MGQVAGKVAIVTGGASGIGAASVETLAREGAKVLVTDIGDALGAEVVARIEAAGGEAFFRHQDVTDELAWPEIVEAALGRYGRLDIMVANAGVCMGGPIVEMSLADWRRQTAINLDGVFMSVKFAIPAMAKTGGGSIIITSSVAGLRGSSGFASYCASKGGVRLFAKAAAMECAAMGVNIRVNSVHPGIIDTPLWDKMPTGSAVGHNASLWAKAVVPLPSLWAKAVVPLARAGQAQDIANGVLYLASDLSSYVTGSELVIDGGRTAG
ncbi:glucose 1-dehydrogenase [Bradyrhizobium sp. Ash2021]|uniref:SDR family NAD(P)-dependent oxidoreductase n=1 Tax=Bradyrhizobium sp. Ash2021 TaxID=2954771 RepID=UPI002815A0D6|nr:glucose 1-dehydrogenase [Bradyrhizobium sp. Ash2021]WMT72664.1 glucose 1-dehydrogenase [Bradyrhizobium sp. Ash2021]